MFLFPEGAKPGSQWNQLRDVWPHGVKTVIISLSPFKHTLMSCAFIMVYNSQDSLVVNYLHFADMK